MQYDAKTKNRLKRAEGQLRGILKMMEDDEDCKKVVTQLSAARTAIDRIIGVVVSTNLERCVRESIESGTDHSEAVEEAVKLLIRSQ
ncbi:metal-sensitive transcriptional regulator [Actinomycetes bacterium NPDC127524]|uniref:metal-sensitive transcriptional regulator n=1 Tax=Bacillus sp. MUM 13 TaxID=1678001 RepID=UPI0008F5A47B|nr:metal-sensitive transcriptional regulator [Bacillus sp. MUM 13]OIK13357.1 cytoplasmic protein [Bacillus sp. MUM 13]